MWSILATLMIIVGSCYAFPQVVRSITRGNSKGISSWFILLWISNSTLSLAYVIHIKDIALIIKYSILTIFVLIIAWYKRID